MRMACFAENARIASEISGRNFAIYCRHCAAMLNAWDLSAGQNCFILYLYARLCSFVQLNEITSFVWRKTVNTNGCSSHAKQRTLSNSSNNFIGPEDRLLLPWADCRMRLIKSSFSFKKIRFRPVNSGAVLWNTMKDRTPDRLRPVKNLIQIDAVVRKMYQYNMAGYYIRETMTLDSTENCSEKKILTFAVAGGHSIYK